MGVAATLPELVEWTLMLSFDNILRSRITI